MTGQVMRLIWGNQPLFVLAQGGKQASAGLQRNHKTMSINVSVNYD